MNVFDHPVWRRFLPLFLVTWSLLTAPPPVESSSGEGPLRPFTSDGCSLFPNGIPGRSELWLDCCTAHDRTYWLGGTYQQRLEADMQLHDCVSATGMSFIADLMLEGVRLGGSPFFPTWYRWGYGWTYLRGYKPLTPKELALARALENSGGD